MNTERIAKAFSELHYGPSPESTALVDTWLDQHQRTFGHYINGEFTTPATDRLFESTNPARAQVLARLTDGNSDDIDSSVAAAQAAFPLWSSTPGHERARYLYAISRGIQKHARFFAVLESMDNGKPIRESRDIDIPLVAGHFLHHAGWAQLFEREFSGHQPIGVIGQIIPWNFPLLMLAWKIAPALAAGNTVVLKPAEFTSLTALRFAELLRDIGLPKGVVNVVTGHGGTGAALVGHPNVKKIAFTGSTEVGKIIARQTAGTDKKLSLELGGKSPFIVFEDADLDSAVEGIVDAIWLNQGQVCCAGSRLLIQSSIESVFLDKLKTRMSKLKLGDSLDKGIDIGAMVDPTQEARVKTLVERGRAEGAQIWQDPDSCPSAGSYYPPTIVTNVSPASHLAQEEIFGPVLVVIPFRTHKEAVELANNTVFGLAASVWSENINLALDVAPQIKAGTVWINSTNQFDAASGFGGFRESGIGREGGREGMFEYIEPRWIAGAPPEANISTSAPIQVPETAVDRTTKLYIGGKQVRPDGGNSGQVTVGGRVFGEYALANRKDVRNAVEAAANAQLKLAQTQPRLRSQILYYLAENLTSAGKTLQDYVALAQSDIERELTHAQDRIFEYAAWADKFEGVIHQPAQGGLVLALHEPIGVVGGICPDDSPLVGALSLILPAFALGAPSVVVLSRKHPLVAAFLYHLLDTSDIPAGSINLLTGSENELAPVLAAHSEVSALFHFGSRSLNKELQTLAAENMKRVFVTKRAPDWYNRLESAGRDWLAAATQVKNIWVPYGE